MITVMGASGHIGASLGVADRSRSKSPERGGKLYAENVQLKGVAWRRHDFYRFVAFATCVVGLSNVQAQGQAAVEGMRSVSFFSTSVPMNRRAA